MERKCSMTLSDIHTFFSERYCGGLSLEMEHITNDEQRAWLLQEMESEDDYWKAMVSAEDQKKAAFLMRDSEILDGFLHVKFPQLKRYSLEGCEAVMAGVWMAVEESSRQGVERVVVGMAHRARSNILVNMMHYPASLLFAKIRGKPDVPENVPRVTGDVISHIGHTAVLENSEGQKVQLRIVHNSSHLEAVNPVALGVSRMKQAMPLLLHGDAALAGQGVNYESSQMARLPHFRYGGAIHLVVNNQIGFTAEPDCGRSTHNATDLFKAFEVPVWRASDPVNVMKAVRMASRFRARFGVDTVVDVVGFRRHGHNELDEPSFTNPQMYKKIDSLERPGVLFAKTLLEQKLLDEQELKDFEEQRTQRLQAEFDKELTREIQSHALDHVEQDWKPFVMQKEYTDLETGMKAETLIQIAEKSIAIPKKYKIHKTLQRTFVEGRQKKIEAMQTDQHAKILDWALCEALALGSLAKEGNFVRLCGQDSGRGTFSHRHLELTCQSSGEKFVPLSKLGKIEVVNSFLSELAVLSFEYGISIDSPKNLVVWEAQFGDFFNQGQVAFDAFISCSHEKWQRPTAMTIILPHGYDGAASEHSSCRMERFLQMCSEGMFPEDRTVKSIPNWRIIYPTTPANMFHALRRQLVSDFRVPLIVVGPKIILRHPSCLSSLSDIASGTKFVPVISDENFDAETVIWCTGKTYYDLKAEADNRGITSVSFVRLEELCPFPYAEISQVSANYLKAKRYLWAQEEHENMGAWNHVYPRFCKAVQRLPLLYAGKNPSSTTAVGVSEWHKREVKEYFDLVFDSSSK